KLVSKNTPVKAFNSLDHDFIHCLISNKKAALIISAALFLAKAYVISYAVFSSPVTNASGR
ncbi:hypothetical protein, partial [Vibrio anguillarum]|uniref:hypothetical protein n=1 Tax=Vibrio anguillarum TaxID=55601 RepID=UPI001BE40E18